MIMSSSETIMYATSPSERKEDWIPISVPEKSMSDEEDTEAEEVPGLAALASESSLAHKEGGGGVDFFVGDTSDDQEAEVKDEESSSAPAVATAGEDAGSTSCSTSGRGFSKDLTKDITIIHEILPPGIVAHEEIQVDSLGDDESSSDDPVQTLLQQWSQCVVQPLHKGLDENAKKLRGTMDEHVKPRFDKAKAAVDEHVKPHIEKVHARMQSFQSQTSKNWEDLSSSTRSLMEVHIKPGLENVKKGTAEGFETMKRGTLEGLETSKWILSDIPGHSQRAMDEHVLPTVENLKLESKKTIQTIAIQSNEGYQKHVQPQVEKAQKVHTTYSSCYMGRAPGLFEEHETRFHMILAEASLRAFGKVLFCDNPATGGCIWLAMIFGSPIVALCALSSVASLAYIAQYLNVVEPSVLKKGDLGVNAVLVGAGSAAFLKFEHPLLGCIGSLMVASFILPPITLLVYLHCTRSRLFHSTTDAVPSMPTLLIPYNLVMIAFLVTAVFWDRSLVVPPVLETEAMTTPHLGRAILNGITKVFLVQGVFSGLLIVGGTLLCSRILAGSMVVGSIVATLMGWMFGMPTVALNAGIAGYNAVLTTAALAYFFEPSWTLLVIGVFVIVLCELFEAVFAIFFWDALGLPITLTLGFCFATVAILMLDSEESCSRAGVLKRIPEDKLSTPDEFLAARAAAADTALYSPDNSNLAPAAAWMEEDGDDEEGHFVVVSHPSAKDKTKDDDGKIPSESTPLLPTKDGLDV